MSWFLPRHKDWLIFCTIHLWDCQAKYTQTRLFYTARIGMNYSRCEILSFFKWLVKWQDLLGRHNSPCILLAQQASITAESSNHNPLSKEVWKSCRIFPNFQHPRNWLFTWLRPKEVTDAEQDLQRLDLLVKTELNWTGLKYVQCSSMPVFTPPCSTSLTLETLRALILLMNPSEM